MALTVLPMLAPGLTRGAYWLAGGAAAVALIVSLLAHELAHAIVARRAGLEVRRITLWLLGGVSELTKQPSRAGAELRIALVGPVVSVVLGGLFAAVSWTAVILGAPVLVVATVSWLATVNVVLGVFNLLPGTPLDGGRVLHGVIWWHSGDRERATRYATGAGQFVSSSGTVVSSGSSPPLIWRGPSNSERYAPTTREPRAPGPRLRRQRSHPSRRGGEAGPSGADVVAGDADPCAAGLPRCSDVDPAARTP